MIISTTLSSNISIRLATSSDVSDIAKIHFVSWKKVYLGIHSNSFYDKRDEQSFTTYWQNYFHNQCPLSFTLVATEANSIIGFVSAGPLLDKALNTINHDCELYKLYILPDYQNRGIGKKLLVACENKLKEDHCKQMLVRAIKENVNSCIFYEKQGGRLIGERVCLLDPAVHEVFYNFIL